MEIKDMTYKDLIKNVTEPMNIELTQREEHILRVAFHVMLKDKVAKLRWDVLFENEKQRDDYDLTCSCGALYHFEDANEANSFAESYFYCPVCGRKWQKVLA
jgi:hypothetical protein